MIEKNAFNAVIPNCHIIVISTIRLGFEAIVEFSEEKTFASIIIYSFQNATVYLLFLTMQLLYHKSKTLMAHYMVQ